MQDITESIDFLKDAFRGWRQDFEKYMAFAFPGLSPSAVVSQIGSIYQEGPTRDVTETRSVYLSEWVGTRGERIIDRRTSAKTNFISTFYGKDAINRLNDERIIELGLSIFKDLDDQMISGIGGISWDMRLKAMGTWTGKQAFMTRVYKGRDGFLHVDAPLIEVYSLYHDVDVGPEDRLRVVREFTKKWSDLPAFYAQFGDGTIQAPPLPDGKKPNEEATICDYWCREPDGELYHAYMVNIGTDSQGAPRHVPLREEVSWTNHGHTTMPITVVPRLITPGEFGQASRLPGTSSFHSKYRHHALPFFARAMNPILFYQGLESMAADAAGMNALPIFQHFQPTDGSPPAKKPVVPMAMWEMAEGERVEILKGIQQGQVTVSEAIARIKAELNDVFPDFLVSPGVLPNIAGYAFNSQIEQASIYMTSWTRMDEACKRALLKSVIEQHKNTFPKDAFKVHGIMPSDGRRFGHRFDASDYPEEEFDVDVEEPAEIPGKLAQQANLGMQLHQAGAISMFAFRTSMGIGQPQKMQEQIDDELFESSPENQNVEKVRRLGVKIVELEAALKDERSEEHTSNSNHRL